MKKFLMLCCCMQLLAGAAMAANEKIDPKGFICAEMVAISVSSGQPPLFEALQIDGYASGVDGTVNADPDIMLPLLEQVFAGCQKVPAEKLLPVWQAAKKNITVAETPWKADKTTCKDYSANEEDGSGFLIWLDGYNRGKTKGTASVLESDAAIKSYLEACAKKPEALMIDVMQEYLKK